MDMITNAYGGDVRRQCTYPSSVARRYRQSHDCVSGRIMPAFNTAVRLIWNKTEQM